MVSKALIHYPELYVPDSEGSAVCGRSEGCNWVEYGSRSDVLRCGRLEQDDIALVIALCLRQRSSPRFIHSTKLTECYITIPHEARRLDVFVCREPRNLSTGKDVPHDRSVASIITDGEPSRTSFASIVGNDPQHIFEVKIKSSFDCKCIVM